MTSSAESDLGPPELFVVDAPYNEEIDGCAYLKQGDQEIFLNQEMAENLAIDLMRAYGLSWWPEPEDDPT